MIIISHDRHFLNSVCTHMADMDFGTLRVYPGNYDDYMLASTQARERQLAANAKAKEKIADLQDFVRRFSANKSKARQATSRARQIDKIKLEDVKPSSRQYPFIRFEYDDKEKLHRLAVEVKGMSKSYDAADQGWTYASRPARRSRSSAPTASARPRCCAAWSASRSVRAGRRHGQMGREGATSAIAPRTMPRISPDIDADRLDAAVAARRRRRPVVRATLGRLLFSGDDAQEIGQGAFRRRRRAHALRQADAADAPTCC